MKCTNFFIKILTAHSGLSSKRLCGFAGWVVCLFICIWCTILVIPAPEIVDLLFICSTSLLGIDSVTSIWKKNINKNEDNTETTTRKHHTEG